MGCDFKPGDEVVCVRDDHDWEMVSLTPPVVGGVYTVTQVFARLPYRGARGGDAGVDLAELPVSPIAAYPARCFRKVQRRKTDLSIEAFLTIKPGQFEEPKRPAKKRERVS